MKPSLSDWITHVFDHSVADPAWHWSSDAPAWEGSSEDTVAFIADTFERSGELLARFTDAQLNQGFWYLTSAGVSDLMFALVEPGVPLAARLRAIRSFLPLFEQVMAIRCSPHLSHLDEQPANPLNGACYMWWDIPPDPRQARRSRAHRIRCRGSSSAFSAAFDSTRRLSRERTSRHQRMAALLSDHRDNR
jgi:hypothetical protein